MTETIKPSLSNRMVKPANSRKAKSSQNAIERWIQLEQKSSRIRERLLFVNRFENFRLERHQEDLRSSEEDVLRDIFRTKDHMKLSLIDIAKSKRQIKNSKCDFERNIRRGESTPVFSSERDRLKQKERDLRGLQTRLQGPNSQLLAAHVQDELKMIEYRNSVGWNDVQITKTLPSIGERIDNTSVSFESQINHEKQHPRSPDGSPRHQLTQQHKESTGLASDASVNIKNGEQSDTKTDAKKKTRRHIALPHILESNASIRVKRELINQEPASSDSTLLSPVPEERLPSRPSQDLEDPLPLPAIAGRKQLLPMSQEQPSTEDTSDRELLSNATPGEVHLPPLKDLPPKKSKTSKCRAEMQRKLLKNTKTTATISTTDVMIERRERNAQKRVAQVRMKTKEQVQKVTASGNKGPSQREEVTRKQGDDDGTRGMEHSLNSIEYSRSKRKHAGYVVKQVLSRPSDGGIRLPPIRVDPLLLQELKRQRVKHRMQSTSLPKLPN